MFKRLFNWFKKRQQQKINCPIISGTFELKLIVLTPKETKYGSLRIVSKENWSKERFFYQLEDMAEQVWCMVGSQEAG
jgi:hypothetical protein